MPAPSSPILIVDDDELSRDLLLLLLESAGHAVQASHSGDSALAALRAGEIPAPAAILTDLQMPGLTGNPLAHRLRDLCGPGPSILAISATRPPAEAISAFDGFLLKPFTAAQLASALRTPVKPAPTATPTARTTDDTPDLSEATYAALTASMKPDQLHQLYVFSLTDTASRVGRMRAAAASGDAATYIREAHAIKGSCGFLGALMMYSQAAAMEAGGLPTLALLDQISASAARLQRILESRFKP